jgi:predicted HicB family RNase H-like nuclease
MKKQLTVQIPVRVAPELKKALLEQAKLQKRSLSNLIRLKLEWVIQYERQSVA